MYSSAFEVERNATRRIRHLKAKISIVFGMCAAILTVVLAGAALDNVAVAKGLQSNNGAATKGEKSSGNDNYNYVGTWATSPMHLNQNQNNQGFNNQTLREIVHTSVGGDHVRVRLSNVFGNKPLKIGAANVGIRTSGASVTSNRELTFGGKTSVIIPAGARVWSDPVDLHVSALDDLAISIYVPGNPTNITYHSLALQTSYVSPPGNFTGETSMPTSTTTSHWFWLTGVDVSAPKHSAAIVTLGDSITDGTHSTPNTNSRWPNVLAKRLVRQRGNGKLGVLDEGISGNRLLHNTVGINALARYDRDVLTQTGVKYVIVLEGVNDLGFPNLGDAYTNQAVSAENVIDALKQLIIRAHLLHISIYGGTITPYQGADYYTKQGEAKREKINQWIRSSGAFDGVIDFAAAVADPNNPKQLRPAYDSGGHLHPNDAGYKAMANQIDLSLFTQHRGFDHRYQHHHRYH